MDQKWTPKVSGKTDLKTIFDKKQNFDQKTFFNIKKRFFIKNFEKNEKNRKKMTKK